MSEAAAVIGVVLSFLEKGGLIGKSPPPPPQNLAREKRKYQKGKKNCGRARREEDKNAKGEKRCGKGKEKALNPYNQKQRK